MTRAGNWILADDGKTPVSCEDLLTWAAWFKERSNCRVAYDRTADGHHVSTLFLGIDRNFGADEPPILWETMIFGGPFDEEQRRYTSYEDAVRGHAEMLEMAKKGTRD